MMRWDDTAIHVIDFEGSLRTGIVEYGIVTLTNGVVTKAYTRICKAKAKISAQEAATHGIQTEDTEFTSAFEASWDLFVGLRKAGPFCAHHAGVEMSLIKGSWPYPPEVPNFAEASSTHADWGPFIDTCALYKTLFPKLKSYKLETLIQATNSQALLDKLAKEHCPEDRNHYHAALYDALASACLLIYLRQFPQCKDASLSWLFKSSLASALKQANYSQQSLKW